MGFYHKKTSACARRHRSHPSSASRFPGSVSSLSLRLPGFPVACCSLTLPHSGATAPDFHRLPLLSLHRLLVRLAIVNWLKSITITVFLSIQVIQVGGFIEKMQYRELFMERNLGDGAMIHLKTPMGFPVAGNPFC